MERLPNLPIRFEEGSCHAYTSSNALICSSKYYEGTSNAGKECYHTNDGITYKSAGYLTTNHQQGKMVGYGNGQVMMVGGKDYPTCTMEEYLQNGSWLVRSGCDFPGVVGFRQVL